MSASVVRNPDPALRAGAFGNATALVCRECGATQPLGPFYACTECFGPLEIGYDFPRSPASRSRPAPRTSGATSRCCRCPTDITPSPQHGARLHPAGQRRQPRPASSASAGLWVKDDSGQPDALVQGPRRRDRAVRGPRARLQGLRLPVDRQPGQRGGRRRRPGRHPHGRVHPARPRAGQDPDDRGVRRLAGRRRGTYDDVNRLASEIAGEEEGWAFVNVNVRPYYAEGSKTLAFEVAEQLGWRLPEQVVDPGRQRLAADQDRQGLPGADQARPGRGHALHGSSARRPTGCSPVSAAFKAGHDVVRPVKPDTIAKSLAIGNPADGPYVLDVARRTGGAVEDVTDDEVRDGHPAARPHRGHLRRDRRRRHGRRR